MNDINENLVADSPDSAEADNAGLVQPSDQVTFLPSQGIKYWFVCCVPIILLVALANFVLWTGALPMGTQGTETHGHAICLLLGLLAPRAWSSVSQIMAMLRAQFVKRERLEMIGHYRVIKKLGAGGMGEVYLAEHALMNRKCAIKLIHPSRADNQETQRSFEIEAKATARLTHWNTIEIYDYGTASDGRFYYVMEYLEGLNLRQFVDMYGPISPSRLIYMLKQLCESLYEAECLGLVHRDIKPSNIFLTRRGQSCDVVKLLDFGLVQEACEGSVKVNGANKKLKGSPSYMCPEQAIGAQVDHRGDLYSLGCVAYFLLSGRPPFLDNNPVMLVVAHATTNAPPLQEIVPDVPRDLAWVIMKCLRRNPEDRYQSSRELLRALENCSCHSGWDYGKAETWWKNNHQPVVETTILSEDTGKTIVMNEATLQASETTIVVHNSEFLSEQIAEINAAGL